MKTININGKTVKTNLGGSYSINTRQQHKTMRLMIRDSIHETDEEMFARLVSYGYTHITFYYSTTRIPGLYDLFAYVK